VTQGIVNDQKNLPHGLSSLNQAEHSRKSSWFEHRPRMQKPNSDRLDSERTSARRRNTVESKLGEQEEKIHGVNEEATNTKESYQPTNQCSKLSGHLFVFEAREGSTAARIEPDRGRGHRTTSAELTQSSEHSANTIISKGDLYRQR
jgi:hypothetical protein